MLLLNNVRKVHWLLIGGLLTFHFSSVYFNSGFHEKTTCTQLKIKTENIKHLVH